MSKAAPQHRASPLARVAFAFLLSAALAAPTGWAEAVAATRVAGTISSAVPGEQSVELVSTRLDYSTAPVQLAIQLSPLDDAEIAPPAARGPLRIGVHREVPPQFRGELAPALAWRELADGTIVTSISLSSPSAVSVRLGLVAKLPEGGEIRFFDPARPTGRRFPAVVVDDFFIGEDGEPEVLWSPTVQGETIGLEVMLPSREAAGSFSLTLENIAHRYRAMSSPATATNLQCNTHIDVQCRRGSFPAGQEDAVARIEFEAEGGSGLCSGTLLNGVESRPYFLTANHCVSTGTVARTVAVTWFYQYRSCGSSDLDSRAVRVYGGADVLATSEDQDSSLLLLRTELPPGLPLSGWSAFTLAQPKFVHNISHPAGLDKKYAAGRGRRIAEDVLEVVWSEGTTEFGSSGSGLFDGEHLIGVLAIGEERCGPGTTDYFGAFSDFYPQVARWLNPATQDDHGDTRQDATRVGPNSTTQGNLEQGGDVDYFGVAVPSRGTVVVETTGSTDTLGRLENAAGRQIASDDDSGTGGNFRIRRTRNPGTYYVRVWGYDSSATGRYALRISHTPARPPTTATATSSTPLGDFNGDGRADVLLRRTDNGRWFFYPMNGRHVLPGQGGVALTSNLAWAVAGLGDFNGDRRDDVLLRRNDGQWHYYPLSGRRVLSGPGRVPLTRDLAWAVAGTGDFNGDGRDEVLLRRTDNGSWHYYPLNGRRVLPGRGGVSLTKNRAWTVAGIGDFNGDGRDDVLMRRSDNGRWFYYPMNGRQVLSERGGVPLTNNRAWAVAGIGDFNRDGRDDVLMRHRDGRWHYYPMAGRAVRSGAGSANLTRNVSIAVAGIGDLNGDGRDDVLMRRANGTWHYYPMNGRRSLSGAGGVPLTSNLTWAVAGRRD